MNEHGLGGAASLDKSMRLFLELLGGAGGGKLAVAAAACGVPASTARRGVTALLRLGLLARVGRGEYGPGVSLVGLPHAGLQDVLRRAARPLLRRLAVQEGATAHLAVLESDMVTYLVKEQGGARPVLSRELIQLEAYCSAVGKMLLAHLPPPARDAYLAAGPFVALTANTITDPDRLGAALRRVAAEGYATDNAELEPGLYCLAVPLRGPDGVVLAAISLSGLPQSTPGSAVRANLQGCADKISARLGWVKEGKAGAPPLGPA